MKFTLECCIPALTVIMFFGASLRQSEAFQNAPRKKYDNVPHQSSDQSEPPLIEKLLSISKEAQQKSQSIIKSAKKDGQVIKIYLNGELNWHIFLSYSNNQKYGYIVFPCRELAKNESDKIHELMSNNHLMGLTRFEIRQGFLRICTPFQLSMLNPDTLNQMIEETVNQAKTTTKLWVKSTKPVELFPKKNKVVKGKSPTSKSQAGKVGQLVQLDQICRNGKTQMATLQLQSVANHDYFGMITFGPDKSFAMKVSDVAKDSKIEISGTYKVIDNELHLIVVQPNSDKKVRFTYLPHQRDGKKVVLKSENGGKDTMTFLNF